MIRTLAIRNFITVSSLDLDLSSGFTALTGETGAGKSLLINALSLLLGDRGETHVIRQGSDRSELTAEFDIPAQLQDVIAAQLEEAGLESDLSNGLMVRRTIELAGRSRGWINGRPATMQQLRSLGEQLVDIHGQHEHQNLLKPAAQQLLLDRHSGQVPLLQQVQAAYDHYHQLQEALARAESESQLLALERDRLRWTVEETRLLALEADEWARLSDEQQRLAHGAELLTQSQAVYQLLVEADETITAQCSQSHQRLSALVEKDPRLTDAVRCLEAASIQLQEAGSELGRYLDRLDLDPDRLATVESRLSQIYDLARKLRVRPEDLPEVQARAEADLAALEEKTDIEGLRRKAAAAEQAYRALAESLSAARQAAAQPFAEAVTVWLKELAMPNSRFLVALEPRRQPSRNGLEEVIFQLQHQVNAPGQALAKTASGGELSRVSLAIATVAALATDTPTLIFDEVDAGIGGNTGHTVGRLLRQLGEAHQVLVVTHLPQVAARGNHHIQVSKTLESGQPASALTTLDVEARILEVARMLGDEGVRDHSRALAQELLGLSSS